MGALIPLVGLRFGSLVVLERIPLDSMVQGRSRSRFGSAGVTVVVRWMSVATIFGMGAVEVVAVVRANRVCASGA